MLICDPLQAVSIQHAVISEAATIIGDLTLGASFK